MKLKGSCPDNKLPKDILSTGVEGIRSAVDTFNRAIKFDKINEKRPEFGPYMKENTQVKPLK
jgi:hypothetical protein